MRARARERERERVLIGLLINRMHSLAALIISAAHHRGSLTRKTPVPRYYINGISDSVIFQQNLPVSTEIIKLAIFLIVLIYMRNYAHAVVDRRILVLLFRPLGQRATLQSTTPKIREVRQVCEMKNSKFK